MSQVPTTTTTNKTTRRLEPPWITRGSYSWPVRHWPWEQHRLLRIIITSTCSMHHRIHSIVLIRLSNVKGKKKKKWNQRMRWMRPPYRTQPCRSYKLSPRRRRRIHLGNYYFLILRWNNHPKIIPKARKPRRRHRRFLLWNRKGRTTKNNPMMSV